MISATPATSSSSSRGFTLLEVMVAMVITLVGLLGLLQSVNIATEHNMKNQLREEAVQIADEYVSELRTRPFGSLSTTRTVPSRLLGVQKNFQVRLTRGDAIPNSDARELSVRVSWSYRNLSSHHEVRTVRSP